MAAIGNFFLALTALIFLVGFNMLYLQRIPRTGDALVGYGWAMIFLSLAYFATTLIVTSMIGAKGGFVWVGSTRTARFWLVTLGFLSMAIGFGLSAIIKNETGGVTFLMRTVYTVTPVIIPLLFISGSAILLNPVTFQSVSPGIPKALLLGSAGVGALCILVNMAGSMALSQRNHAAAMESAKVSEDNQLRSTLETIETTDVNTAMGSLLVYTDHMQDAVIRNAALDKIHSRQDWEQGMIDLLSTDWAPEVFTFLASNDVPDPQKFHDPIRTGILKEGALMRKSIREAWHASNLYEEQFYYDVQRVLAVVKKYRRTPQDYLPEIQELRNALDEPSEFTKPKFQCTGALESYIRKAGK